MALDYPMLAQFAQTWGLVLAMILFGLATLYALWPRNRATFDRAARMPLIDDESGD